MKDLMVKNIGQEGSKDRLHLPLHGKAYKRLKIHNEIQTYIQT